MQVYGNALRPRRHGAWPRAHAAARVACALAVLASTVAAGGCRDAAPPPAHAEARPAPSARAVETALRSVEQYLAAARTREALQVAARLAQEAPDQMRVQEAHARALVALAFDPETAPEERARLMEDAAAAYDRAAALDPGNAALHHAAGMASSTAGRQEAALEHFERAAHLEPANAQFQLYLGLALARAGDFARARAALESAAGRAPASPDPHAALADLAVREGDLPAARRSIATARSLDPAALPLRLADARIRRLARHPEEALDLLLALDPPQRLDPAVAEEIALAHRAMGDYRAAAIVLEHSAEAAPSDGRRAERCSEAWQLAGDPVKAKVWLERAAVARPAPPR